MSQQELADAMGYRTRSTIAKIEAGENDITQGKLQKMAAILGTTAEALISEEPTESNIPEISAEPTKNVRNKTIAIILAGGNSGNNQQGIPSQFVSVRGKPLFVYSMTAYQSHPSVDAIYIVCLKGWEDIVKAYAHQYGITKLKGLIAAGYSGIQSLKNGIDVIKGLYAPNDTIIIQEATRPMVNTETISKLLQACAEQGSATICHSMDDYVQFDISQKVPNYLDRNHIVAVQSPEAHKLSLITEVFQKTVQRRHALAESCFTMLMYNLGYNIFFIEGGLNNIKIAKDEDIAVFSSLASEI